MKKIKVLAMAAAAVMMGFTSCNKDNGGETPASTLKQVEVRIKPGTGTRAAGSDEAGKGQEDVINDNWYAFAENATGGTYTCVQATGTGATAFATFTQVPVNSTVYVIANINAATVVPTGTTVTKAQIEALVESVKKADLQANNAALQASVGAPAVAPMLMSGSAKVLNAPLDPADNSKVKLTVSLEREYAKVNMTVSETSGANFTAGANTLTLVSIDQISAYRVVNRIAPFTSFHGASVADNAEWFIVKTPFYTADISANNGTPAVGASDIVFNYPAISAGGNATQNFYVTPNYSALNAYATAVIVEATVNGIYGGLNYVNAKRYYRAYVYDADIVAEKGQTLKNTIYNISASINGIGEGTPGEALDKDNVDLNVYVTVKKWAVRAFTTVME